MWIRCVSSQAKLLLLVGTLRLAPLVVHVQRCSPIHPCHHLEVRVVEAVHSDHAGLGVEVAFV